MATKRMASKTSPSAATTKRSTANVDSSAGFNSEDSIDSIRQVSGARSSSRSSSTGGEKNIWKELIANPAVRYVAGGIATAVLTKVASNLSARYPEISRFINENLDGVEGRLAEFKNGLNSNSEASRH